MADSNVPITSGTGTNIDTQVPSGGDHRQVIVLGDPDTVAGVATVANGGVNVNLNQGVFPSSTGQNSTTQLAAAATFTGTIETIANHTAAQIEITSDQPMTIYVDQFIDSGGTRLSSTDTFTRAASVPFNENLTLPGNYFRIRVTNTGASTTTTFRSDVTFGMMQTTPRAPSNLGNGRVGIMEVNGTATSVGSGVTDAGTMRVVLPTDQAAVSTKAADTSAAISIAANATSSGSVTGLTNAGRAIIQLTGTFTATVQVQITVDGSTWVNLTGTSVYNAATTSAVSSGNVTAVGAYWADVTGATGVRVITTAYTSGTVTGTVRVVQGTGTVVGVVGVPTVSISGYPTSAASADALANPTVTKIDATMLSFNGTTWDRVRSGTYTSNVDTSSARTVTGNGVTAVNFSGANNLTVWINVTAVSGTSPTCVFKLQWSPDNGTTWLDWDTTNLQSTSLTAVTTATLKVGINAVTAVNAAKQDYLPRQIRLAWTIGGTTPSFTFATWWTFTG